LGKAPVEWRKNEEKRPRLRTPNSPVRSPGDLLDIESS
jgi:hypothetical protein